MPATPDYAQSVMAVSLALQQCLTFDELADQLTNVLPKVLPIRAFALDWKQKDRSIHKVCDWSLEGVAIPPDSQLQFQVSTGLLPDLVENMATDFPPISPAASPSQAQGSAAAPWRGYWLKARSRKVGTFKLCLQSWAIPQFPHNSQILSAIAEQIGVTVYRLVMLQRLQSENLQDPLTGLFNRRHMMGILSKLLKRVSYGQYQVGLIMLDLDHFKQVNDTFGHDVGDKVLQTVGLFLRGYARPNDVVCRYGGEEFTLILPDISLEILERRAHQLCRSVHYLNPNMENISLKITLSVGFAIAPLHARSPSGLIKSADEALYQAKQTGRDRAVGASTQTTSRSG